MGRGDKEERDCAANVYCLKLHIGYWRKLEKLRQVQSQTFKLVGTSLTFSYNYIEDVCSWNWDLYENIVKKKKESEEKIDLVKWGGFLLYFELTLNLLISIGRVWVSAQVAVNPGKTKLDELSVQLCLYYLSGIRPLDSLPHLPTLMLQVHLSLSSFHVCPLWLASHKQCTILYSCHQTLF